MFYTGSLSEERGLETHEDLSAVVRLHYSLIILVHSKLGEKNCWVLPHLVCFVWAYLNQGHYQILEVFCTLKHSANETCNACADVYIVIPSLRLSRLLVVGNWCCDEAVEGGQRKVVRFKEHLFEIYPLRCQCVECDQCPFIRMLDAVVDMKLEHDVFWHYDLLLTLARSYQPAEQLQDSIDHFFLVISFRLHGQCLEYDLYHLIERLGGHESLCICLDGAVDESLECAWTRIDPIKRLVSDICKEQLEDLREKSTHVLADELA